MPILTQISNVALFFIVSSQIRKKRTVGRTV